MRRAHKVDGTQKGVVDALRAAAFLVVDLSGAGVPGFPDLLVGRNGRWVLVEVKIRTGKLSENQDDWHRRALQYGPCVVVHDGQEAVRILTTICVPSSTRRTFA